MSSIYMLTEINCQCSQFMRRDFFNLNIAEKYLSIPVLTSGVLFRSLQSSSCITLLFSVCIVTCL